MSAPIGIVCATRSEIAPFLEAMDVVSTDKKAMVEMYRGNIRWLRCRGDLLWHLQDQRRHGGTVYDRLLRRFLRY